MLHGVTLLKRRKGCKNGEGDMEVCEAKGI